jgi:hypothetical protein
MPAPQAGLPYGAGGNSALDFAPMLLGALGPIGAAVGLLGTGFLQQRRKQGLLQERSALIDQATGGGDIAGLSLEELANGIQRLQAAGVEPQAGMQDMLDFRQAQQTAIRGQQDAVDLQNMQAQQALQAADARATQSMGLEQFRQGEANRRTQFTQSQENARAIAALEQAKALNPEGSKALARDLSIVGSPGQMLQPYAREIDTSTGATRRILSAPATGYGDMVRIFSLMKVLDPTSTVREGEYAKAGSVAGFMERFGGYLKQVQNGQQLTPAQREELRAAALEIQKQNDTQYGSVLDQARRQARALGVSPAGEAALVDPRVPDWNNPDVRVVNW